MKISRKLNSHFYKQFKNFKDQIFDQLLESTYEQIDIKIKNHLRNKIYIRLRDQIEYNIDTSFKSSLNEL